MTFDLAEKFISINGEGRWAGELAVFLRFSGCNLRCSYCDTMWANEKDCVTTSNSIDDIERFVTNSGAKHVTVTGGEPLLQENIFALFELLTNLNVQIEVETNGSVLLAPFMEKFPNASFTMDYKMPSSNMENKMCLQNLPILRCNDTLKLVSGSYSDLEKAKDLIDTVDENVLIFLSPVFGEIEACDMVDYIIKNKLTRLKLQLQLHKYIWNPDEKGV